MADDPAAEIAALFAEWSRNPDHLRFGQFAVNRLAPPGVTLPEVFFEADPEKAKAKLLEAWPKIRG